MAVVSSRKSDFKDMYTGFTTQDVGLGTIDPNAYASQAYRKKKIDKILIGTLNRIIYAGFEHDKEPLVLVMAYEPRYNTIIGYNMHYLPEKFRKAILDLVLKSNLARIKKNNPLIVNYTMIKKAVPASLGAIRRYKVVGVKVVDQYKIVEWNDVIQEKSKWSGMYKNVGKKKGGAFDWLDRIFKRFIG